MNIILIFLLLYFVFNSQRIEAKLTDQRLSISNNQISIKPLVNFSKYIIKNDSGFVIKLKNGKKLTLSDDYRFIDYYEKIGYFFFSHFDPDRPYRLIDIQNGKQYELISPIALSPSKKQFICFSTEAENHKYLEIYRFTPKGIIFEWTITGGYSNKISWRPIDAHWINNTTISFAKLSETKEKGIIKKINGRWKLIEKNQIKQNLAQNCLKKNFYEDNFDDCSRWKESLILKQYPHFLRRDGDLLSLIAANGKIEYLLDKQNSGETSSRFLVTNHLKKLNISLIVYSGWEWGGLFIFDHLTGELLKESVEPIISPNKLFFLFSNQEADFDIEGPPLRIYKRSSKGFSKELEFYFEEEWIPRELKWLNDEHIRFVSVYKDQTMCKKSLINIKRIKNDWRVYDDDFCYLQISNKISF